MDPLDPSGSRHSSIRALINHEQDASHSDRGPTAVPSMAATAVASPSGIPNGPPPVFASARWPPPNPLHNGSNMIPSAEARRPSDDTKLPSIHEALSNAPPPAPYTSPISSGGPPSHHQQHSFSAPRPYPENGRLPPQAHHAGPPPPPLGPYARSEPAPASFPEANRHAPSGLQNAPAPPHNPYAAPRFEPRFDERVQERMPTYGHHSTTQPSYAYGGDPAAPAHPHDPAYSQPRYPGREAREHLEWKGRDDDKTVRPPFKEGLKRHLDVWDFENNLAQVSSGSDPTSHPTQVSLQQINVASSALQEWSRHYNAIAQEQQRRPNAIPDRMPTLESCDDMIEHQERIYGALHRMRETIYQQEHAALADQRLREQGKNAGEYDEEMAMYETEKRETFVSSEGKKRRGRAAPPGRCHSCNRAETPEWRRGPDGARTLCNACGLHYAKLTRKNTMNKGQGSNRSSLRPKMEEGSQ